MAVAFLALRLLPTPDRREMLLRYGFLPIQNQQFRHREPAAWITRRNTANCPAVV
jgi:hypothetical protein